MATGPTVSASRSSLVYKPKYHYYILMRTYCNSSDLRLFLIYILIWFRETGHLKIKDFARNIRFDFCQLFAHPKSITHIW